ncbi:hypothetical protein D9757_009596 [Collybiopsis confluens]|uniref:Uncharacterized protein n=1 Tax=Collybiopsis confluens TaxID=2823264 RepID=A0A8H5H4V8_9AGAR|nr:hypothetical protein D9757_009596 [Collybiopsis confluens]
MSSSRFGLGNLGVIWVLRIAWEPVEFPSPFANAEYMYTILDVRPYAYLLTLRRRAGSLH